MIMSLDSVLIISFTGIFVGIILAIIAGIGMFLEDEQPKETPIKDFFKSLNK